MKGESNSGLSLPSPQRVRTCDNRPAIHGVGFARNCVPDDRNRLTAVAFYSAAGALQKQVAYTYDVNDQLIEKQVDDTGNGIFDRAQRFVYDDDDVVLVFDASGSLTDRYLWAPQIDQLLADENAVGNVLWPLVDNQNTVRDLVDSTGAVVDHLVYDANGNIVSQTNAADQPLFAFTGQMWDADAGLQYNRARWYDPETGRFVSQDPKSFAAGDPNLYRYVTNDPLNAVDPTGWQQLQNQATPILQRTTAIESGGVNSTFTVTNPSDGPTVIIQLVTFIGPNGKREQYYEVIGFIPAGGTQIVYDGSQSTVQQITVTESGGFSFGSNPPPTRVPPGQHNDRFANSGTGTQTGAAHLLKLDSGGLLLKELKTWHARRARGKPPGAESGQTTSTTVTSGFLSALPVPKDSGAARTKSDRFQRKWFDNSRSLLATAPLLTVEFSSGSVGSVTQIP